MSRFILVSGRVMSAPYVNHVNLVQNILRQALLYLTNKSSTKCGNWYAGKVKCTNDQCCDKIYVNNVNIVIGRLYIGIYDWFRTTDTGAQIGAVFFDIKKAFDTIPHCTLIEKLKALNISPIIIRWIFIT